MLTQIWIKPLRRSREKTILYFNLPSGAPLHILSKLYDVPVGFVTPPPYFEAEYCLFCGRRRVAVARYRMICLVLFNLYIFAFLTA